MNTKKTFHVGLIGAGYVSEFHLMALKRLQEAKVVGICDLDPDRAAAAAKLADAPAFPSVEGLLDSRPDVVHILTPPSSHADLAIQAMEAQCHVLVEKPLATSVEDCDRIADAARRTGRQLCVNHSLLRDPFIVQALRMVRSGKLGQVLAVDYFRSSEYTPWSGGAVPPQYREGGYPFRDLGVHALYLMQEFLGGIEDAQCKYRSASELSRDPNLLFDEWRALVTGPGGVGQIQISWNVLPLQHQLFIQGTRGTLRVDLFSLFNARRGNTPLPKSIERAYNASAEAWQMQVQVTANVVRFLRGRLLPYHGLQMLVKDFYECLGAGKAVPVNAEAARPVVEWTERLAREADAAKKAYLQKFPAELTARVLVTGAGGFIGRHLVSRLLKDGQRIRILVRREPPDELMKDQRVEVVLGDLGDPAVVDRAVKGVDLVYHVGAAMRGGREDFERGTVVGTGNVVDSVLRHQVSKLVYVSSLSVLHAASAQPGMRVKEDWPLEPQPEARGFYTQSKLEAERIVSLAVAKRGLPAVILRPGQVFGPGVPLITPAVARRMGKRLVVLGDGRLVLPLVYVEDVVDALLLAANSNRWDGPVFHIVDTAQVTQNEFVEKVCGTDLKITHWPLPVVFTLAYGVELLGKALRRSVPLSRYRVRSALAPFSFDCAAARDGLGWVASVGVAVGLQRTLQA